MIIRDLLEILELEKLLKLDLSERDVLFVKTYYEKTKELNDDEYYTSQISYMEDVWRCANTEKRIAYEEGVQEKTKSTIINMLNKGFNDNEIKEILNIGDDILNKIKKEF